MIRPFGQLLKRARKMPTLCLARTISDRAGDGEAILDLFIGGVVRPD
jgi:hypothetical protein